MSGIAIHMSLTAHTMCTYTHTHHAHTRTHTRTHIQVYWFKFILRLLYKILILGEKVQDTREFDEEEEGKLKENGETEPKVKKP